MKVKKTWEQCSRGVRPVFTCQCGCKVFNLVRRTFLEVDFSQEGEIEGHPFLRDKGLTGEYHFTCVECDKEVPFEQANEMLKEILGGANNAV